LVANFLLVRGTYCIIVTPKSGRKVLFFFGEEYAEALRQLKKLLPAELSKQQQS
jgi:hypothetical protein